MARHRKPVVKHPIRRAILAFLGLLTAFTLVGCLAGASGTGETIAPEQAHTVVAALTATGGPDYSATDSAALAALMDSYQVGGASDGRLGESWWATATTLDAVVQQARVSGDRRYLADIAHTYVTNRDAFGPDFKNHYYDDSGWWGLLWIHAYRLTGDARYLASAEDIDQYMADAWTPACGGGVVWAKSIIVSGAQKNSITNEIYLQLSAELAATTHRAAYQVRANAEWAWFRHSGLIRDYDLVTDRLSDDCTPIAVPLTYTQGPVLAGLVALSQVDHDPSLLTEAQKLADASTRSPYLNPGGILREPCEPHCEGDGEEFKGSFVQPLGDLNRLLPTHPYTAYLDRQVASMLANDQFSGARFGTSFAGPPDVTTPVRQATAVSAITATMR